MVYCLVLLHLEVLVHKAEDLVDFACFNKFGIEEENVPTPKVSITASYSAGGGKHQNGGQALEWMKFGSLEPRQGSNRSSRYQ